MIGTISIPTRSIASTATISRSTRPSGISTTRHCWRRWRSYPPGAWA
jgi:hypothetical protein